MLAAIVNSDVTSAAAADAFFDMNMDDQEIESVQSVQGEGNTKPHPSASKRWCFTWNNYSEEQFVQLVQVFGLMELDGADWIIGREVGESGTPHLQGYVRAKKRWRPSQLGNWWNKAHWEKCKGTHEQNVKYCAKEGNYTKSAGTEVRRPIAQIETADLRPHQVAIAEQFKEPEDPKFGRKIHWFYEKQGGWGKSVLATYMVDQMGAIEVGGGAKDCFFGLVAAMEKRDVPIVIFYIPMCQLGYVSYQAIEKIKDGKFFSSKYESGMVRFNRPWVICFANEEPAYESLSEDRWVVEELSAPPLGAGGGAAE